MTLDGDERLLVRDEDIASVASLMLTTMAMIAERRKDGDDGAAGGAMGGGMGGMEM